MAILQGLLVLASRSLSGVLNAIFGWAVLALFGHRAEKEKTILSGMVGAAAAWPLLLVGIAFPKAMAMAVAFVPMSGSIPASVLRGVWIGLAVIVPFALGLMFASRSPPQSPPEPFWKRALRGIPLTIGLGAAFLMMLGIAPVLQIVSAIRKRRDDHVPLLTEAKVYQATADRIRSSFAAHGLNLSAVQPPWWMTLPSALLRTAGGRVTTAFVPAHLAYFSGPELDFALYPSEALMRGKPSVLARAHGIMSETLGPLDALETTGTAAQEMERRLKKIWRTFDELALPPANAEGLGQAVREILRDMNRTELSEDDWRILYRESLQVLRAISGKPQLLQAAEGSVPQTAGGSA